MGARYLGTGSQDEKYPSTPRCQSCVRSSWHRGEFYIITSPSLCYLITHTLFSLWGLVSLLHSCVFSGAAMLKGCQVLSMEEYILDSYPHRSKIEVAENALSTHIRSHIRPDCNDLILHFFLESPPKSSLQFIFNPHGVLAPPQTHCPCFLHHCLHLRYWGYCSAVPCSIL